MLAQFVSQIWLCLPATLVDFSLDSCLITELLLNPKCPISPTRVNNCEQEVMCVQRQISERPSIHFFSPLPAKRSFDSTLYCTGFGPSIFVRALITEPDEYSTEISSDEGTFNPMSLAIFPTIFLYHERITPYKKHSKTYRV